MHRGGYNKSAHGRHCNAVTKDWVVEDIIFFYDLESRGCNGVHLTLICI